MSSILDGPLTSLAFCWRIERQDGAGLGLTTHDREFIIGGVTYSAAPGMLPAAVQRSAGLEPSDGEVAGAITSEALAEEDLAMGRWDGARISLFAADWQQPGSPIMALMKGELGEVRFEQHQFKATLRGATARLEQAACPETSPECRAELGDKECRVDLAGRTMLAKIVALDGPGLVLNRTVDADFRWGHARFLSGANCGLVTTITAANNDHIELRDIAKAEIAIGDRLELRHGCDKRFATCRDRFANAANFRGEPHLPGNDLLTRYPGA